MHTNSVVVGELARAGKLRILGVSSAERLPSYPDVPTYKEQGFDVQPAQVRGVMGAAGLPPAIVARLRSLLERTVNDPEFQEYLKLAELEPAWFEGPGDHETGRNQSTSAGSHRATRFDERAQTTGARPIAIVPARAKLWADGVACLFLFSLALTIFWDARRYPEALVPGAPGPALFPQIIAGLILLSALALLV